MVDPTQSGFRILALTLRSGMTLDKLLNPLYSSFIISKMRVIRIWDINEDNDKMRCRVVMNIK